MPLLERESFLTQLNDRLAATRGGQGRLVLISGEAGIGKTSLVNAFVAGLPRGTRTLRGGCDPVVPPRPFAPVYDMAAQAQDGLREALATADRDRVFERFMVVLERLGSGSVVVLEDLHWADTATLDLLRVVGRRLLDMPALIVGTYRPHDIDAEHPFRLALGDLPSGLVVDLALEPLSLAGVAALVARSQADAEEIHRATGGNPFFVTELMASGGSAVPSTVRDAVMARVGRLSDEARDVLRAAAVLGSRGKPPLLTAVAEGPGAAAGLREAVARGMLIEAEGLLSFRHELARHAVLDAMAPAQRTRLHARALAALRSGAAPADVVRLAQHAIEAGDTAAIIDLAPKAAEQAGGLGAHGQAADYLAIALALLGDGTVDLRGELLERYAYECSVADRIAAARAAQESALEIWRDLGDQRREGNGMRALATYMWLGGEGNRARQVAQSAVDLLESVEPHGRELAQAYAKIAQLLLNSAQDDAAALSFASQALELAERLGDEATAVHALTTLALAYTYPEGPVDLSVLEEAYRRARVARLSEDTMRAVINLVETGRDMRRYDLVDRYAGEAIDFLRDHEFELYRALLESRVAQLSLERGNWDAAERQARALLAASSNPNQVRVRALEVLGSLLSRRGEPGAWAALDEAMAIVGAGELQEICPLHAARAEAAWLEGDMGKAGDEARRGFDLAVGTGAPFWYSDVSFLAWRTGRLDELPEGTAEPYVLFAAGDFRGAAAAWDRIGCPYRRAEALAESSKEVDLREALDLLLALGARPLADKVTQRLRYLGAKNIARGPRPTTRANPLGLSDRELDVLGLIRHGLRNAEIAERLVVSPKTVDHHVSAVLRKLGVPDREAARLEADRLGLEFGEPGRPI